MSHAASPNAIVSLGDVKQYLALAEGDTSHDDLLQYWINAVSGTIEDHLRGPVVPQIYQDEIHDGNGMATLPVEQQPIVSLQNNFAQDVMVRSEPGGEWELLEENPEYILVDRTRPWSIRLYDKVFPPGTANIKVCYIAGYPVIPGAISRVCIEAVAEIFKESNHGTGRLGQRSRSIGGINASGATDAFIDLSERHRQLLAPFVRVTP